MREPPYRVMIVEDEVVPAEYLTSIIHDDPRFVVHATASNATQAREMLHQEPIDLIFMDIMIEGALSGAELALEIHRDYPEILIIFATAYSDEEMTDYAAEAEAFAYLLKPYRPKQIAATLKLAATRLLGSLSQPTAPEVLDLVDGYRYDLARQRLEHDGQSIDLSTHERELLHLLALERHRAMTKEALMQRLELSDDSLRALIYRLRKRTTPELVRNVMRSGYRLGVAIAASGT